MNITDPLAVFNPLPLIILPVPKPLSGQDEVRRFGNGGRCG